jgi:outer membrane protein OmpA-like peptidoglycan-associated protein
MKHYSLFIGLLLICTSIFSQDENLLENGSFEALKGKLKGLGGIEIAADWKSTSKTKADLFVKENKIPLVLTSGNSYGKEEPKEGENYAGIIAYSYNDKLARTYIYSPLSSPMAKGGKYCVTMFVSLAEGSKYASNNLAFHFSNKPLDQEEKKVIVEASHVLHPQKKIINASYGWEKICGTYTAEGGEKFVTIGNFSTNEDTKYEKTPKNNTYKGTPIIAAYYFVDEIHIQTTEPKVMCECYENENIKKDAFYHKMIMMEDHMNPIQRIEAHTTFFPFGQYQLQEANKSTLNVIISIMKGNPDFQLELFGHIDEEEQTLAIKKPVFAELGKKRIRATMEYLIENGIEESRLISTPKDESEPNEEILPDDDPELKMAKNRRVMFKVIQK